ncbi:ATP-binding protein [Halorubrum amylolyticum]|uniref:ATP-binding protein n=1 Tax=Halorubrum amylolyticum TaxID=2508724 RepID=UPI0013E8CE24|nr:ATP-binding protein [Halorubrum amylolyticum]
MFRPRGHRIIADIGIALFLAAAVHHGFEVGSVAGAAGPLLALALDGGIAVAVVYAGSRVAAVDFEPTEERRVARWTVVGTLTAVGAIGATFLVRAFEGRPLVEPAFPLLVAAGAGALAGTVAGYYAVRSAAEARRARDATRAVSFVNHLLRHDLRNDLSAIRGYADLADGEVDPDGSPRDLDADTVPDSPPSAVIARKAEEGLDRIEATGAVADALLGRSSLRRVDLAETTRDVLAGVADRPGVTVDADIADAAPVRANDGLRSVVDNLVENAVEHAGPEVTVRVAVRDGDERVTLTVADDGPGIPPERRESLLGDAGADAVATGVAPGDDRSGDEETEADAVGGLRIVSTLVDRYGGDLAIGESDLGGVRVEVSLPRAEPGQGS